MRYVQKFDATYNKYIQNLRRRGHLFRTRDYELAGSPLSLPARMVCAALYDTWLFQNTAEVSIVGGVTLWCLLVVNVSTTERERRERSKER